MMLLVGTMAIPIAYKREAIAIGFQYLSKQDKAKRSGVSARYC